MHSSCPAQETGRHSFRLNTSPVSALAGLEKLIAPQTDFNSLKRSLSRLDRMHTAFATACPPPWPAPGLHITPEIRYQSELWLPLASIKPVFERFYQAALRYPPILSSTPFANAASWADVVSGLPLLVGPTANPANLLGQLMHSKELRTTFLFHSFLPRRFYGGLIRYPQQEQFIRARLSGRHPDQKTPLRCLDAACGDGAASYGLAMLLLDSGWPPDAFRIEGWTLDPLEAWAGAHACFPHDRRRESMLRKWCAPVFSQGAAASMLFRQADLARPPEKDEKFDLILCNGLLGGPIVNRQGDVKRIVENLASMLAPGGMLLAADHFHGGWKMNIPGETLGDVFKACGLHNVQAGEGVSGSKF